MALEIQFVPTSLDEKSSGYLKLQLLGADEKYDFLDEVGLDFDKKGEIKFNESQLKMMAKTIRAVGKYIKEVKIESKDKKYKSWEELKSDPEMESVVVEVATQYLKGFSASKN